MSLFGIKAGITAINSEKGKKIPGSFTLVSIVIYFSLAEYSSS